jgi:hypothetical protein
MRANEPLASTSNQAPLLNRKDPPGHKRPKAIYRKPVLRRLGALRSVGSDVHWLRHR